VFTARYALSPYIKQIGFVFKGLNCTKSHYRIIAVAGVRRTTPRRPEPMTNHCRTPFRGTDWRAITLRRPVKFLWGHKITVLDAERVLGTKQVWEGGKHRLYPPHPCDHTHRYGCRTPLIVTLYFTTKSAVLLGSQSRIQKRDYSTDPFA
jgi:hypothetical protein